VKTRTRISSVALRALCACLAFAPAFADRTPTHKQQEQPEEPKAAQLTPDARAAALLARAAQDTPVPRQELEKLAPERLLGFKRSSLESKLNQFGQAECVEVDAIFEGPATQMLHLKLADIGGLDMIMQVPMPAEGTSLEERGGTYAGVRVRGYAGSLQEAVGDGPSTLTLYASNRIRLQLVGYSLPGRKLLEAAEGIDLAKLAALVPDPPQQVDAPR